MKSDNSEYRKKWVRVRQRLTASLQSLGYPDVLGDEIAKNLGSPKAMERMISYLQYVKPGSIELVVDEMLAIKSEIGAWREKKASEEANARYNEILYYGLSDDNSEDEDDA